MKLQFNDIIVEYIKDVTKVPLIIIDQDENLVFYNHSFDSSFSKNDIEKLLSEIKRCNFNDKEDKKLMTTHRCNFQKESGDNIYIFCKSILSDDYQLIAFEEYKLHDDEVIKKMSELNIDISNMTRELSKKNIQLKKANEQVEILLHTDVLTGVKNRRAYYIHLDEMISKSRANNTTFGLIMIDIDFFKLVNDKYGHDIGDIVLERFSRELEDSINDSSEVYRIGGEEFAILVDYQIIEDITILAEKIRKNISEMKIADIKENITASFGVSMFDIHNNKNDLMKKADEYLYIAKKQGRNKVVYK